MRSRALLLLTVMMAATLLMAASPAWAANFTVNSTADLPDRSLGAEGCFTGRLVLGGGIALEKECTLRAAIQEANINSQSDSITFGSWLSGTTITLTQGELTIANDNTSGPDLTIAGPGGSGLSVNGNNNSGVFAIDHSDATIDRITIRGGNSETGFGGGIINSFGTLTLTNSTVSDNTSDDSIGGGGIYNGGTLTLTNSTVSGNKNTGAAHGGGIANYGTLTLTNSTISGNTSRFAGGGIYSGGGSPVTLTNSTVSGNTAGSFGGGIFNVHNGGPAKLANTIVAGNDDGNGHPDASGAFTSLGNNLVGNTAGATGFGGSDLLNRNPLLGPLQNNGGPTSTRAIWPSSPAIDAADNARCLFADQRGVARKDGDGNGSVVCDIGAYERSDFSSPKVSSTTPAAGVTGVSRGANISATFSEKMTRSTLNSATFKLFKVNLDGSTTAISSWSVSSTTDGLKATLNPFGTSSTLLAANTTYKAVVTTGARDLAGNQLDQSPILAGKQQKAWTFRTGST